METNISKNKTKSDLPLRKNIRPAQRLYVPPAQRNKKKQINCISEPLDAIKTEDVEESKSVPITNVSQECKRNISIELVDGSHKGLLNSCASSESNDKKNVVNMNFSNVETKTENVQCSEEDKQSLMIMLNSLKIHEDKNIDIDEEEMERAIVNINRKSRPLIKHVNISNKEVLHINFGDKGVKINKPISKMEKKIDEQVSNWEDLFNEDDEIIGEMMEQIVDYIDTKTEESSDDEEYQKKNLEPTDLDHVIELYDFPSSFKTQDLIQLYNEVNNDSMYVKWCDETHALLVLSTPIQAKRALQISHEIIKSRSMLQASSIAVQVAVRSNLKPAMKRPQTNMQTARRLINTHLGTRSRLTKEEQAKEREELRKAKELKRAHRQCENDAWDGHPRPSTT